MDELSFRIGLLVCEFGLRLNCVDYDIATYQPCDVVPHNTYRAGGISVCSPCIIRRGSVGCFFEHGRENPLYLGEFHVLIRD